MKNIRYTLLIPAAGLGAVLLAVLRTLILPTKQYGFGGRFAVSYLVVAATVLVLAGMLALGVQKKSVVYPVMRGRRLFVAAVAAVGLGGGLTLRELFDAWRWFAQGVKPPPAVQVDSAVSLVMLVCEILFGLIAGGVLVYMGLTWLGKGEAARERFRVAALTPVFWMWMRLGRYMLSYTSAVKVEQSFYNFAMFLAELLFVYAFARYLAGVGKRSRLLPVYGAACAVLAMSGAVTAAVLEATNRLDAYQVTQLAGVTDFLMGLFAWAVTAALGVTEEPAASAEPEEGASDAVWEAFVAESEPETSDSAAESAEPAESAGEESPIREEQ